MIRDTQEGKPDIDRVFDGPLVDRLATHLTKGAAKYPDNEDGTPNWMNANSQQEMIRFRKSAARHFRQWMRGDNDEDHFSATTFNMNAYEMVKQKLQLAQQIEKESALSAVERYSSSVTITNPVLSTSVSTTSPY